MVKMGHLHPAVITMQDAVMTSAGLDFRNEDFLAQRLSRSKARSASIHDRGGAERDSVGRAPGNICSNDHHRVVPGPRRAILESISRECHATLLEQSATVR
jgi:hypothetical protein